MLGQSKILLIVILTTGLIFIPLGCQHHTPGEAELIQVSMGTSRSVNGALAFVAHELNYFKQEGLDLDLQIFEEGAVVMDKLLANNVDTVIIVGGTAVATAFREEELRVICSVSSSDNDSRIVARKDRGISTPGDLRYKRVGTVGSSTHFFLSLFMLKNGLSERDLELVVDSPDVLIESFSAGGFDAVALFGPYIKQGELALDETEAVVFSEPGLYTKHFTFVSKKAYIEQEPDVINHLLKAFLRAEEYIQSNPDEAMLITARYLDRQPEETKDAWDAFAFRVSMKQSLLMTFENEAKWISTIDLQKAGHIPNFLNIFYLDPLKELAPQRVTIIE